MDTWAYIYKLHIFQQLDILYTMNQFLPLRNNRAITTATPSQTHLTKTNFFLYLPPRFCNSFWELNWRRQSHLFFHNISEYLNRKTRAYNTDEETRGSVYDGNQLPSVTWDIPKRDMLISNQVLQNRNADRFPRHLKQRWIAPEREPEFDRHRLFGLLTHLSRLTEIAFQGYLMGWCPADKGEVGMVWFWRIMCMLEGGYYTRDCQCCGQPCQLITGRKGKVLNVHNVRLVWMLYTKLWLLWALVEDDHLGWNIAPLVKSLQCLGWWGE